MVRTRTLRRKGSQGHCTHAEQNKRWSIVGGLPFWEWHWVCKCSKIVAQLLGPLKVLRVLNGNNKPPKTTRTEPKNIKKHWTTDGRERGG